MLPPEKMTPRLMSLLRVDVEAPLGRVRDGAFLCQRFMIGSNCNRLCLNPGPTLPRGPCEWHDAAERLINVAHCCQMCPFNHLRKHKVSAKRRQKTGKVLPKHSLESKCVTYLSKWRRGDKCCGFLHSPWLLFLRRQLHRESVLGFLVGTF